MIDKYAPTTKEYDTKVQPGESIVDYMDRWIKNHKPLEAVKLPSGRFVTREAAEAMGYTIIEGKNEKPQP